MIDLKKNYLPKELTSYDFLKSFAVITMIIDHIGMCLFPEQMEWRVIGRLSMPVWLFLIGYANTRDLSSLLWIGGSMLVIGDIIIGNSIFNVNILFTILLARLCLDRIMDVFLKDRESMIFTTVALAILVLPTGMIFDYGTHAFFFAMFGYLVRHQNDLSISNRLIWGFMGVSILIHGMFQQLSFQFNTMEALFAVLGMLLVCAYMTNFKLKLYQDLDQKLPTALKSPIKVMGRHSLEIYVLHLLILKLIAVPLHPDHLGWFQWHWF